MGEAELKHEINIVPVPPEYVNSVWEDIAPLLEKALNRSNGELGLEDVYKCLIEATMQAGLCVVDHELAAVIVTEIVDYPKKRAVRLILGGGSHLHEWAPALDDAMQARAEEVGADLIEIWGRPGWMRFLNNFWDHAKTRAVVMTRRVHGQNINH